MYMQIYFHTYMIYVYIHTYANFIALLLNFFNWTLVFVLLSNSPLKRCRESAR